jgi:uncharacterized membrane protein
VNKKEFLDRLRSSLGGLPKDEIAERITFYSEMIDDRMEEGLSEEEAVDDVERNAGVSSVKDGTATPIGATSSKKRKTWELVLIVAGLPLWLSLLLAAFAVILSLYASLWAVVVSLWAAFGAIVGCAFGGIVGGAGLAIGGFGAMGTAAIGAGLVLAGLSVFLFLGCRAVTRGAVWLSGRPFIKGKKREVRA